MNSIVWTGILRRSRRLCLLLFLMAVAMSAPYGLAAAAEATVYKSPWCGCCSGWVDHMRANGYSVRVKDMESLDLVKKMLSVPEPLQSCHTATIDGYVIEGHVPAADVKRLLSERPKITGLATPGMPVGSPGMEGGTPEPYDVVTFDAEGEVTIYARH